MEVTKPGLDEMYCSSCRAIIKRQAEICVRCGVRVATASPPSVEAAKPGVDEMYCPSCGAIIKRQAEICVKCGVRVSTVVAGVGATAEYSDKSRLTAGLLGILLGGIGVHRFYLGNIGIGILQIIVSLITLGIGSLWGFIEGVIIIAGGGWKDARGRPLRKYGE